MGANDQVETFSIPSSLAKSGAFLSVPVDLSLSFVCLYPLANLLPVCGDLPWCINSNAYLAVLNTQNREFDIVTNTD